MKVIVIDGQGGRLGQLIIENIKSNNIQCEITAIGTNSIATSAMIKAGATEAATGENPVVVACRTADIIIGPIGIVSADSLLGEVTATMATAIGRSEAIKLLVPVNKCNNKVVGVKQMSFNELVNETISELKSILALYI